MISDWVATVFTVILVAIALFIIWSLKMRYLPLIHKLYLGIAISFGIWLAAHENALDMGLFYLYRRRVFSGVHPLYRFGIHQRLGADAPFGMGHLYRAGAD